MKHKLNRVMVRMFLLIVLATALFTPTRHAFAATCTSAASGDWTSSSTWTGCTTPQAGDTVIIGSSHAVTNGQGSIANLTINSGSLALGGDLTVTGTGS